MKQTYCQKQEKMLTFKEQLISVLKETRVVEKESEQGGVLV